MVSKAARENLEHYIRDAQLTLDKYATDFTVSRYLMSQYDPAEVEQLLADRVQARATKLGKALAELQAWLTDQTSTRPILRARAPQRRKRPASGGPKTL